MKYPFVIFILLLWSFRTAGQIQNIAIFDGIDDGILIEADGAIATIQAFTIEAQFKISQYTTAPILTRKTTDHTGIFTLGLRDSLIQFQLHVDRNNSVSVESPMALSTNRWYHVAAAYTGDSVLIYIEGQLTVQQEINRQVNSSFNGYTLVGIDRESELNYTQAFNGCLDEVRIWNSVRTRREILRNITYEIDPADPDMLLYYTMSGSGDQVIDQSDEGNNGLKVGNDGPQNTPVVLNPFSTVSQIPTEYDICSGDYIEIDLIEHIDYNVSPSGLFSTQGTRLISMPIDRDTMIQIVSNNPCCITNDTLLIPIRLSAIETVSDVDIGCAASYIEQDGQRYFVGDSIVTSHMTISGCDSISVGIVQSSTFDIAINSEPACNNRNGAINFVWDSDMTIDQIIINSTPMATVDTRIDDLPGGLYLVEVINEDGCNYTETVRIINTSDGDPLNYYAPNAISLSSSNGNNCFSPSFNDVNLLLQYELSIFDRWGNQVFQSDSPQSCWDGSINGEAVASGVYIWRFEAIVSSCSAALTISDIGELLVVK